MLYGLVAAAIAAVVGMLPAGQDRTIHSFTGPYLMVGGQQWVDRRAIEAFRPKDSLR